MKILYHSPRESFNVKKGSGKRPYEMFRSLKGLGHDVDIIQGRGKNRLRKVFGESMEWDKYDFCYSEPPSSPIHPLYDYPFLYKIRKHDVPLAVFYRDTYWKFADHFSKDGVKKYVFRAAHFAEVDLYTKLADIVYFPSEYSLELSLKAATRDVLWPGCNKQNPIEREEVSDIIYVGGISERYGIHNLVGMMRELENNDIVLHLVCREGEYERLNDKTSNAIESLPIYVYHESGEGLEPIYNKSDIGIIPFRDTYYNNMAMPVKLFEYMSFGLPVVSTKCKTIARFVENNGCGVICRDDPVELAEGVMSLMHDLGKVNTISKNSIETAKRNTWEDRAAEVCAFFS
ncbi:glycosyltransferase [Halovivax cerinus]|uniref:Glycosyltransferase n=1 Tax=Halovivax cerinus TaxID=1487865 RepID=A0ABD5NPY1_9EURY|nr:glycosyltransferase [Halovivax cerinus]